MSLFLILVAVTANPYPQDCFGLGNRASIAWARFSGLGTRSSCCVPFRRITSAAWGTRRTVWWLAWTHRACGCLFPVLGQTDILIASLWLWQTIQWKRFTVAHSSKVHSPSWQRRHGRRSMRQPVTGHPQPGGRGMEASSQLAFSFLFRSRQQPKETCLLDDSRSCQVNFLVIKRSKEPRQTVSSLHGDTLELQSRPKLVLAFPLGQEKQLGWRLQIQNTWVLGFWVTRNHVHLQEVQDPGIKGYRFWKELLDKEKKREKELLKDKNGQLRVETGSSKARSTMVTLFCQAECVEETEPRSLINL